MDEDSKQILSNLRTALRSRGARSIRGISRVFRIMDSHDRNKKLDREEFQQGLHDVGVELPQQQIDTLFSIFDKDGDGTVNFNEFLVGVRGGLNDTRQPLVDQAFNKLDKDGSGEIEVSDLHGVYSAADHPKVRSGELTEDQVFQSFLSAFNDKNQDGKISKDEWDEYYEEVSSNIDSDEYFVQMMKNCWKL